MRVYLKVSSKTRSIDNVAKQASLWQQPQHVFQLLRLQLKRKFPDHLPFAWFVIDVLSQMAEVLICKWVANWVI